MEDTGRSSSWRDLALIIGIAIVVRIAAFLLNSRGNPGFDYPVMDSMHIDRWARGIAAGEGSGGVYFRGPLVAYLLALVYKLSGGSIAAAVLVNHAAGVVTCALVYFLARTWFARWVAVVAGLIAALYWPMVYFEGEILLEPVFMMLMAFGLWGTARAARRPTIARCIIAGAWLGLAALARPTILAFLPAVPFVFFFARARSGRFRSPREPLLRGVLVIIVAVMMLVPATVHNLSAGGAFVPVAWSGGLNFFIGNNGSSDGRSAYIPGARSEWMGGEDEALAIAAEQASRALTPAEASDFYLRRGLAWIAENPLAAAKLCLKKLHMFWEGPERSNEKYIYFFWDRFGLGRIPMPGFWLISPLALGAMVLLWPRRRELSMLYLFALAYMLGIVSFFVVARYRLPVVPVLIVFAAWMIVDSFECVRDRRWRNFARNAALCAGFFVVANASYPEFLRTRPQHIAMSHYMLAGALMEHKDEEGVIRELDAARRAYERAPNRFYMSMAQDIYFKLGALWYERGRCEEAMRALGHVQPSDPRSQPALHMYADCCEKLGRTADGVRVYEMLLEGDPGNRDALAGLIRCLEATGDSVRAAEARKQLQTP